MDKRLQNKNERAINKRNVDLIIAREEAKIKKTDEKKETGNPKIDGPLEDFERVYGFKFEPKFADDMKYGGVAKPKSKPKNFKKTVQKQKRDRAIASGDMTIGDFNEMTPSMMQDFYKNASKVKKMEGGGEAVPSKFKGFSKLPEGVQQRLTPKLASKYEVGGEAKNRTNAKKFKKNVAADRKSKVTKKLDKKNPVRALARIVDDEFESSNIHDYGGIHVGGKVYTDKDRGTNKKLYKPQKPSKVGPKKFDEKIGPIEKMRKGGKVQKYGGGGSVKGGKMSCRGMGAAVKGGGYTIS